VDGQDVVSLQAAFEEAKQTKGKPTAILAKTFKGAGFPKISDKENWHGAALGDNAGEIISLLEEKIRMTSSVCGDSILKPTAPANILQPAENVPVKMTEKPNYKIGQKVSNGLQNNGRGLFL